MHFVRTEDLKTGMRLARPVYNKKSILLFDRNSLLSVQAIESIRNFGPIGVYVLEPAEPLPPMTQEDLEFLRNRKRLLVALDHCLTEREYKILVMRYGILGYKEYTQQEVGDALGISRSYVSRMEKKALQKLAAELKEE